MCGLAGYFDPAGPAKHRVLGAMAARLAHRGPDDKGVFVDGGLGLAHRRLAVIELSRAGAQPMVSHDGRHVIAFNGEIYNHRDLRDRLTGIAWRGSSDTETLAEAIARWGVPATLSLMAGMFAFAAWDRGTGELVLARDRLGEKPLYVGWQGGQLLFASELGALQAHPSFRREIDCAAVRELLEFGRISAPRSIHAGIGKLPAGHWLKVETRSARPGHLPAPVSYWSLKDTALRGLASPLEPDFEAAVDAVEAQLQRSLAEEQIADVPLGVFLSGGIDSSLVATMLQAGSSGPVRTFTIGFEEAGFDESSHARRIAEHLGATHHELHLHTADALALVPRLAQVYDEPFADPSALPAMLVCQAARTQVTVALGGDGGDEAFGGYPAQARTMATWRRFGRLPWALRKAAADMMEALPAGTVNALLDHGAARHGTLPSHRLRTLASLLRPDSPFALARRFARHDPEVDTLLAFDPTTHRPPAFDPAPGGAVDAYELAADAHARGLPLGAAITLADAASSLPDLLLTKTDRAAMSVSLETRSPLLDHRLVELAWRIPFSMHHDARGPKRILRAILARHIPNTLYERPKAGFSVPIAQWLRGPLRDWAEALLAEPVLRRQGLLVPTRARSLWAEHLGGRHDHSSQLWDILVLSAWLEARTV